MLQMVGNFVIPFISEGAVLVIIDIAFCLASFLSIRFRFMGLGVGLIPCGFWRIRRLSRVIISNFGILLYLPGTLKVRKLLLSFYESNLLTCFGTN